MNLDVLTTFTTIVREGSLAGAADRLHVTPSTVTARLQTLEAQLGHELIKRSKAGAVPTAAGERIAHNVDTIVALWEQVQRTAALGDTVADHVTIGSEPDLWPGHGETLMGRLDHEDIRVARTVRHGSGPELAVWQRDGRTDLSLTYAPAPRADQRVWDLPSDELVLVADRPDRPTSFDPGYVFVEAGEDFARDHAAAFAWADIARVSFASASAARAHLHAQGGSAYLPARLVADDLAAGALHRLEGVPTFWRRAALVAPLDASERWAWFDVVVEGLGLRPARSTQA
ncbi:MAG: LysR family transcriptional regulator [Actinomycetota bacterium]